ncbi:MAG: LysR family transcriptional regulator [Bacilli bacterium]|jgi:DNA-binding transcriptional LysR family regulator|nr:LysR family transcriptional regulator [Bacilli bacterium]
MDLKQLNYFIAVVENDYNLSKTSKKLNITQPTLSQMIMELEKEFEIKLFDKEFGRFKRLTKIGTKFYNDAKIIISKMEQLNYELKQQSELFKGRVRIGIPPLILTFLCSKSIPKLIDKNEDIRLEINEDNAYTLYDKLQKNIIDLAITTEPINNKDIITKLIYSDTISCYVNKKHPFAKKKIVSLEEIAAEKIMSLPEDYIIYQQIQKVFKSYDLEPDYYFKSGQWDLLLSMADYADGVALLPKPFDDIMSNSGMVAVDIRPAIPWEIVIAYNQNIIKSPDTRYVENFFIDFYKKPTI